MEAGQRIPRRDVMRAEHLLRQGQRQLDLLGRPDCDGLVGGGGDESHLLSGPEKLFRKAKGVRELKNLNYTG